MHARGRLAHARSQLAPAWPHAARLVLVLLSVGLPVAAAESLPDASGASVAGVEAGDGVSVSFDAAPAVDVPTGTARPARRLAVINVQPGQGTLQAALNAANDGDELVLADGTYTGSASDLLWISKSIIIRALNPRGAILDEAALLDALDGGRLAGAALDVQDPEPPLATSRLYSHEKIVLTPHIGWKRLETRQRLVDMVAENVAAYLRGAPVNVVS